MRSQYTIQLEDTLLAQRRQRAIGILQYELNGGLPLKIGEREKSALQEFLAVYDELREQMHQAINGEFPPEIKTRFLDMYAVSVAAQHAMASETLEPGMASVHVDFSGEQYDRRRVLFHSALQPYLQGDEALGSLFGGLRHAAHSASSDEQYAPLRSLTAAFSVAIGEKHYAGFAETSHLATTRFRITEPLVGNEDMLQGLSSALYGLAHFNGVENPLQLRVPKTVSIQGPPGTGKTTGVRQVYACAKELLEPQMSVPFIFKPVSTAFKSSFFGKSAENLRALFQEVREGNAAYVLFADDIDGIFQDRRTLGSSPEERNIMHAILNELDGVLSSDRGNYLFISTSNHALQLDPALDSRLSELILYAPGPQTAAEYALAFERHCNGAAQVDDWLPIGEYAAGQLIPGKVPRTFSGRDVKDVVTNLGLRALLAPMAKTELLVESDTLEQRLTAEDVIRGIDAFLAEKQRRFDQETAEAVSLRAYDKRVEFLAQAQFDAECARQA